MNDTMIQPEEFGKLMSPVPYIHKMRADKPLVGVYVLHGAHGEVERVMASTASEAIQKSTYGRPIKVLRYDPLAQVLLASDEFNFENKPAVDEMVMADLSNPGVADAPQSTDATPMSEAATANPPPADSPSAV